MSNTDPDIDWECSCSECGAHCEDLLSPVCFACRQKMTLVPIEEYKRLQTRIEKLRWALGRSANQVRGLKKGYVYAVRLGNYYPSEVDSLWATQSEAEKRVNDLDESGNNNLWWGVEKMLVSEKR